MTEIKTKGDFEKIIEEKETVLIDFFATWCGPCKMMEPVIDNLQEKYKSNEETAIIKINIDELPEVTAQFNVMSVPTFIVLKNKKESARLIGAVTEEAIIKEIS